MWKKTWKNATPNPPSHAPEFRALPPLAGAVVEELEPVFTDTVLLEGFSASVVEGGEGSRAESVDVGLVGVVEGLTRVVLDVTEVIGIEGGGLRGVGLEMAALEVVGTDIENEGFENDGIEIDGIENDGIENDGIGNDVGTVREHSLFGSQANPGSQHPLPHGVDINGHGFEQSFSPGMHSYPFSQQPMTSVHI